MNRVASISLRRPPANLLNGRSRMMACLFALAFALAAIPAHARTSPMPSDPACLDADCADADATLSEAQKTTGSEKRAAPSATRPAKPGNTRANSTRKPRWHRFLPGMYR